MRAPPRAPCSHSAVSARIRPFCTAERDDLLPTRSWQRCSIRRAPAQRRRLPNRRAGTFLSVIATTRRVRAADRSRKRSADPIELDAMSACRRHMRCAKRRTTLRRSGFCLSSSPRAGSVALLLISRSFLVPKQAGDTESAHYRALERCRRQAPHVPRRSGPCVLLLGWVSRPRSVTVT